MVFGRRTARLVKALPVFLEFVRGPEQGFRRCFADVNNRGLNYVCDAGYRLTAKIISTSEICQCDFAQVVETSVDVNQQQQFLPELHVH